MTISQHGDQSEPQSRAGLLLVEDSRQLGPLIKELLNDVYSVTWVRDGQRGLHAALTGSFAAMVIDRGLPVVDGVELIRAARKDGVTTPILILTAFGAVQDKVDGLDAGADDYMVKPFEIEELLARLRAMTRVHSQPDRHFHIGQWEFDPASRSITSPYESAVSLSNKETMMLELLARHPEKVFSRMEILGAVFDKGDHAGTIDTYVHYLRRKVDHDVIRTVHRVGYQLGTP